MDADNTPTILPLVVYFDSSQYPKTRTAAPMTASQHFAPEPPVLHTPTEVRVSCLPPHAASWEANLPDELALYIKYRDDKDGTALYGIYSDDRRCYNRATGKWDWESNPSSRPEGWSDDHRFTQEEALEIASLMAPHISHSSFTVPTALKALTMTDPDERARYIMDAIRTGWRSQQG